MWAGMRCVFLLALTTLGCGEGITIPEADPLQDGFIVARNHQLDSEGPLSNIWVKTSTDEECGVVYRIDSDTEVWVRGGDGTANKLEVMSLQIGVRVRAWASGAIFDTCPQRTTARSLEVLP